MRGEKLSMLLKMESDNSQTRAPSPNRRCSLELPVKNRGVFSILEMPVGMRSPKAWPSERVPPRVTFVAS